MAKRKSLGFKGGKALVVYIGSSSFGRPSLYIIEQARNAWNEVEVPWLQKIKRNVKRISIQKRAPGSRFAGTWKDGTQTLELLDNGQSSPKYYRCVIVHEMAHSWYDKAARLSEEYIAEFWEAVNKLGPINEYTQDNREKWGKFLYANEIHSAITEYLYAEREMTVGTPENLEQLIRAYNDLHERA